MDEQDELVKEFLIESFEYLDSLDEDLLTLEQDASDPDLLARIFRALHTIKGTGGFLDFDNLVGIAHAGEGLLDCLRKGTIESNGDISSSLFDLVDAIREVLQSIEETGVDGEAKYAELIASLTSLQGGAAKPPPISISKVAAAPAKEPAAKTPDVPEAGSSSDHAADNKTDDANDDAEDEFGSYLTQMAKAFDEIESNLVAMKIHPLDAERIEKILKASKSVVGSSSIMGYRKLISVVISIREQLNNVLQGETTVSDELKEFLFAHVDAARKYLELIKRTEAEGSEEYVALIEKCKEERKEKAAAQAANAAEKAAGKAEEAANAADDKKSAEATPKSKQPDSMSAATATKSKPATSGKQAKETSGRSADSSKRSLADNNIRVNVELLDALMNLVGELVLTRNQILQFIEQSTNPALANSAQNLDLITTELQEGVMKTRMQTIGTIWKKFPRVVRDLAKLCDKEARVEMEGEDTELDKTIIEAIKDPLTHLIRNSVDHGIEKPEDRIRLGKSAEGHLRLRAYHEGGHVNIEIADDGAGIDPEKIKAKALKNGTISQAEATRMSEREILHLVFRSGLSTAQQVSNISGRGVGMDVVKTYIERIGGSVDISSKLGFGTTIKIKIPLTLAIIPALIVKVCGERFALPQVNLLELVRLEGEQIQTEIEMIHETPVHRLRGKLLPLVYLDKVLGLTDSVLHERSTDELSVINIVVLQAEDQPFGLVVNEVVDTGEVVVKPLSKLLKHVTTYAGATIMGDGKIALILDVAGLARNGGVMSQQEHLRSMSDAVMNNDQIKRTTLLLARINENRQVAIPLSMISRLEEIEAQSIEKTGNQEIVQYRGHLMPLIRLSDMLNLAPNDHELNSDNLQVVVCTKNGVNVGMLVNEIVDIVEEHVEVQDRHGFVKSVSIIQNKATDFLSIEEILDTVETGIFELDEHLSNEKALI